MGEHVRKAILSKYLIVGFLLLIFLAPFGVEARGSADFICVLSFAVNGLLFIAKIYRATRRHSVSMDLIYWLFMFFFMYFSPVIQYRLKTFPWRGMVSENEILQVNLVVLLFNIAFLCGCYIARRVKFIGAPALGFCKWLCSSFEFKKRGKILLSLIMCACTAYSLSRTGLTGIFVARAQAIQAFYSGNNSAIELIVESVIPSFMAYVVAEAAQSMIQKKENCFRFVLLFLCLLICFFPTAIPRYKAATIYGVIFIVVFPFISKGSNFFWLFTIGFFLVFPLLHALRNSLSQESIQNMLSNGFFESYTSGNYDAWRMLASALRHNKNYGCTWGGQLLGSLLFFVPSAIWSSKPIGSGAMLIKKELGSSVFANVSCPFVAEGMVNFGIVGVLIFALTLSFLVTKLDSAYWNNAEKNNRRGLFAPYLFLVFMLFFVMRGDLLSGFAYVCGFVATGFMLKPFLK